ncbi:MAG: lipopolysaccharide assembly protein LapA domain-containing protein [bacterium]|nr:lipopolysaccharide assembly protein LapA domain-containing protein [bacterium]
MLAVIFTIIFAILVAFFSTQNTTSVVIQISQYSVSVPLYLVVLLSLLVGFIFAWILHLMNAFASLFALRGKDNAIKKEKKTNAELANKVRDLEIEKTKLETEKKSQSSE